MLEKRWRYRQWQEEEVNERGVSLDAGIFGRDTK